MTDRVKRIMMIAGEASGDIYGAELVKEALLQNRNLEFFGIGGKRMREAGVQTLVDSAEIAVVGFIEVIKHYAVISSAFLKMKRILTDPPPDLLILIDYPGFNMRLAAFAKKSGVKVLYYVSPQIWAWRQGRVKQIARVVDHMAVILPFELPFYRQAGVPVTFVGHPMLDMVKVNMSPSLARERLGLDSNRRVVGLFPGSRRNEVDSLLPVILGAAARLKERFDDLHFIMPVASTLNREDLLKPVKASGLPITLTTERIHEVIKACDAVISVSGTVTLEIAMVNTPLVIIYKLSPLTYLLAKKLIKVPNIGLCNIVAGETVAKELIQGDANPEMIAAEISRILEDQAYHDEIISKLANVRLKLGDGGASGKVARLALELSGATGISGG